MIADIDHFKSYNDSFGHVDGDICLVLVAGALQNAIRPGKDLAARLGGEEFAVILSDLSQDEAIAVADRIRSNVQTLIDGHPRQIRRPVTISIGLAYRSSERDKTHADLMEEADTALYQARIPAATASPPTLRHQAICPAQPRPAHDRPEKERIGKALPCRKG